VGDQFTVYLALTNPAGDKQAVLGTKIDNDYGFTLSTGQSLAGRRRLLTPQFLGNLQIGRNFDVVAGGDTVAAAFLWFRLILNHFYAPDYHCGILSSRENHQFWQVLG